MSMQNSERGQPLPHKNPAPDFIIHLLGSRENEGRGNLTQLAQASQMVLSYVHLIPSMSYVWAACFCDNMFLSEYEILASDFASSGSTRRDEDGSLDRCAACCYYLLLQFASSFPVQQLQTGTFHVILMDPMYNLSWYNMV